MKTTIKSTLFVLSFAIVAALSLSSCKTTGSKPPADGTHTMGHKTNNWPMTNKDMPGY